jgi:hypothetical protein
VGQFRRWIYRTFRIIQRDFGHCKISIEKQTNRFLFLFLFLFQYDRAGVRDRRGDRDPKKRAADIISKLDFSGDKKLSKEEFING